MATVKLKPGKLGPNADKAMEEDPTFRSRAERLSDGRGLRDNTPRNSHAEWSKPTTHRDPIAVLEESNQDRLPELVPIRYGRMLRSPFTFLRGSAALMARDLATTPYTGIRVQSCGDCHLLNFGLFATPERNLVFDINDFDETLPGPWEWDCKRLAVSIVLAARDIHLPATDARDCALKCIYAYRQHLRDYSRLSPLEVWYSRLDMSIITALAPDRQSRKGREEISKKAQQHGAENLSTKMVRKENGRYRFIDQQPTLFHITDANFEKLVHERLEDYRLSLSDERRVLLDRYRIEDYAMKVVGIGSVGTRCYVVLLIDTDDNPLMLQFKEARHSVLEPYCGTSEYRLQGQRVVMGQRLMQSSSDIFLGWVRGRHQHDFYVRQLRDMKFTLPVENCSVAQLRQYAQICGWTLARAHAKSGDAATISGYLGKSDTFENALVAFSTSYADQTERDFSTLTEAVNSGRLEALLEQ